MDSKLTGETELLAAFTDFYVPRRLRGCAETTPKQYAMTIRRFGEFLQRQARVNDLTEDLLAGFLSWRRRTVEAPTANKDRAQLMALANFLAKRGLIVTPDVEAEREPERIPRAWLEEELKRLYKSCAAEPGKLCGVPASLWWRGLHLLAWNTGERIGALMDCRWDWLDFRTGWIVIQAESRKGQTRDKSFRLDDQTLGVLMAMRRPERELIFPWPYCESHLWTRYNRLLERAGLPTDRKSKFHRLRKSVASHATAAGLDATEILDHSNRRVTKSYLDPRIVIPAQPADFLFRLGVER